MDKEKDPKVLAAAAKHFQKFYESEVFSDIVNNFASVCELLDVHPGSFVSFYPALKRNLKSCQGLNLFKFLDERAGSSVYCDNIQAANTKMMVIGGGPVGLRTAIEAQLLGAKVTVIEKRTSLTRNNVLHLWPWVIEDLKSLGAKHFYPRFCTGTMNHISIKRLQCILLKTALCFGVQVYGGVEFKDIVEPQSESDCWTISVNPENHPVGSQDVDVLIGAEGKHVTVPGFRRKEFRGKLAIAITANFANKRTQAEAIVEEISGVAFVYKQDFFNNLYDEFGIALENIVYYKDDTHYFVMTTKKHSLLDRKVLKEDYNDPIALLSQKNINKEALYDYIRDACDYCTDYQLPHLEFALNHHGQPDVALFDFTSMFASGSACHVIERKNRQLLLGLVGDGLLEPFWPTGTGIARGFLGALDAVWMVRQWASGDMSPTEIMEEREAILKLLPQTTPENITKDFKNISIIPKSRYPNLPAHLYKTQQVNHLYNSDTPANADLQRYQHPSFEEIIPNMQFKRQQKQNPINASRMIMKQTEVKTPEVVNAQRDANADEFYLAMREKRRNEMNNDKSEEKVNREKDERRKSENIGVRRTPMNKKTILNDENSKLEFLKKMSNTFGYGKPEQDPTLEEDDGIPITRPKKSDTHINREKQRQIPRYQESARQVDRYDEYKSTNRLHSSVAPIIPELDMAADPELDFLFKGLEHDSEFNKLGENDQQAWLESLFFQDTTNLPGRVQPKDQLNQTKSIPKSSLRVNRESRPRDDVERRNRRNEDETVTAVHVNDKMKSLAEDFFKPKSSENSQKNEKHCEEQAHGGPSNLHKTKSDFHNTVLSDANLHEMQTDTDDSPNRLKDANYETDNDKEMNSEEEKTSLVASFFNSSASHKIKPANEANKKKLVVNTNKPKLVRNIKKPTEVRVSEVYNPEEDDEIERLIRAAEEEQEQMRTKKIEVKKAPPTPPTPPRPVDKRTLALMRRLGNINDILQGKN